MYDDKENTAPIVLQHGHDVHSLSPQKGERRVRSKSMGPGTEDNTITQIHAQMTPTRGILPSQSDEERRAARRKSMANRRVSFAPEATLHTWDVIEYMRDHTVSTEAESTQRTPGAGQSPRRVQDPSSPFDSDPVEEISSSEDDDVEVDDEDVSVAMSMISADGTQRSGSEPSSTSSSAQLERNLRMAAEMAGTKGIEFDEFGDMTMEMAEDEITNAFQPWVQQEDGRRGSATYDQENVDPFQNRKDFAGYSQDGEDVSMDVTRAFGGIIKAQPTVPESSPFGDATMEMTQGVGMIRSVVSPISSKRKYDASPSTQSPLRRSKRRRSTAMQDETASESGDGTMELTQAVGNIHHASRLSGESLDPNEEMSMELTAVLGGIHLPSFRRSARASDAEVLATSSATANGSNSPALSTRASNGSQEQINHDATVDATKRRSSARTRSSAVSTPERHTTPSPAQKSSSGRRRGTAQSTSKQASPSPARRKAANASPKDIPATPVPSTPHKKDSPRTVQAIVPSVKSQANSPLSAEQRPTDHSTPPSVKKSLQPLSDNIKLMSTPRKEGLKTISPKKIVSATRSPAKRTPSKRATTTKLMPVLTDTKSPKRQLMDEFTKLLPTAREAPHIHLQQFLDVAGIRFMDLTTSKRRHTAVRTPKKQVVDDEEDIGSQAVNLEDAIVAAACSEPELELYKHACHELNRYIEEGRSDMKALEAETYKSTPALIQAYMSAESDRRSSLDGQLRDIKSNARLRSKEMWYGWRSTLVDDLMHVLQGIAEGLLNDDDVLTEKERAVARTLPSLLEQRSSLQREVDDLRRATIVVPDDERDDLDAARAQLLAMNQELQQRRAEQQELQNASTTLGSQVDDMRDTRDRLTTAIEQAESRIEVSRSGSVTTLADLKTSIEDFEKQHGWSIVGATSSASLTIRYRSQIELTFQPARFANATGPDSGMSNGPIKLSFCGSDITTTQRFFLQSLQAYLQAMPQRSTLIASMLQTIGEGWTASVDIGKSEQSLRIEGHIETSIKSDECLALTTTILLPRIRTKVRVIFLASVMIDDDLSIDISTTGDIQVVYGKVPKLDSIKDSLSSYARQGADTWQRGLQWLQKEIMTER